MLFVEPVLTVLVDLDMNVVFVFVYNINPNTYNLNYPEVLLIKRGNVSNLIQDEKLSKILENNR